MKRDEQGLTLIELMVALAIGSLLIVGAVFVYVQSSRSFTVSDSVARLQENARYVLSIIEPDVQSAGYYGFSNVPEDFKYIRNGSTASPIQAARLQTTSLPVAGLSAGAQACGNNFAVDLIATVQGSDNDYPLDCVPPPQSGGARPATDTLTIRRASSSPATATAGTLQLLISRLSPTNQYVFDDGTLPDAPAIAEGSVQVRNLLVRTYYVAANSQTPQRIGQPALRVNALISDPANGPRFEDTEVMSGVEDLQIQLGIDTGDYDGNGVIDAGRDTDGDLIPDSPLGIATLYVDPDEVPIGAQVVSVRIWLLVRADRPEIGFVDGKTYTYAGVSVTPNDDFRRVLVSRTIQLRNSRTS